jgi:MFS transporter, SP family, arabinose:H+ symporter
MTSRHVLFVSSVAALGGLLFGYDTAVISGTVEALRLHFALSPLALGWVVGSALIGCVVGAALSGALTDRLGRRSVLSGAAVLFLVSSLWSAVAQSTDSLVAARILGGIGVGFASLLVPVYIAELAPPGPRGALVSLNQVAILLGMVLSYLINRWIGLVGDAHWLADTGWRWMLGAEAAPALIFLGLSALVPESPRWLVKQDRVDEASKILQRLHGLVAARAEMEEIRRAVAHEDGTILDLFRAGSRGIMFMTMMLALFQAITGINIVMYYAPTIFTSAGIATGDALTHSVVIGVVMLISTVGSMFLVDRAGRRAVMLVASAGMGLSLLLLGMMFASGPQHAIWLLVWTLTYVSSFSIGMGGIYWVVVSEIFPTRVRGTAMSLSVIFLWGGNYLVSQFFPYLLAALKGQVFYLFAAMCLLCFVFVMAFVPETKGKTLEQIELEFFGDKSPKAVRILS